MAQESVERSRPTVLRVRGRTASSGSSTTRVARRRRSRRRFGGARRYLGNACRGVVLLVDDDRTVSEHVAYLPHVDQRVEVVLGRVEDVPGLVLASNGPKIIAFVAEPSVSRRSITAAAFRRADLRHGPPGRWSERSSTTARRPARAGAISAASLRLAAAAPCGRVGAFLTPSAVHASVAGLVRRRGLSYQLREFLRPPLGAQNESFSPQTALNALTYAVFSAAADCAGPLKDDARRSDTPEHSTSRATTPKSHMAKI